MQRSQFFRAGAAVAAMILILTALPLAGIAVASHPANSCLDVEPESDTNTAGTAHVLTATLRTLSGDQCTGAVVNATANTTINFDIDGANDTGDPNAVQVDLTCRIQPNSSSCTVQYTGTTAGTDTIFGWLDHDGDGVFDAGEPSDTVTKTWTTGAAARVDCNPETATNPATGTGSEEVYTCTVTDAQGNPVSGVRIDVEQAGANDPDGRGFTDAQNTTVDRNDPCVTGTNGTCTITITGGVAGTGTICFFGDTDVDNVFNAAGGQEDGGDCDTETQATDDNDLTDVVTKTWATAGAPTVVDCNPETATNPATGTGSEEIYTCTVTDAQGNPVSGVRVDVEQAGANDPDNRGFTESPNNAVDRNDPCVTGTNGTCTITITGGVAGTGTICFFGDTDVDNVFNVAGGQEDGGDCETETQADDNDLTDVVTKTWTALLASRLDCAPEAALNQPDTTHVVTCTATNAQGQVVANALIDVEIAGVNDPDNAISPASPDINNCVTNAQGVCTFEHGPNAPNNAQNARVSTAATGSTTYRAWIDGDNNNASIEADATEGRDETAQPGATAEPDATDVVEKTWSTATGARTIDCEPGSATNQVGTNHLVTCTVRNAAGQVVGVGIGVTFTETGAGEIAGATTVATDRNGQAAVTVTSSEAGTQTITGTLTDDILGNEPGEVDECDRAANDPAGAPAGVCADSVTKTWTSGPADGVPNICATNADAIVGTSGNDALVGTEGNDLICVLGGDDTVDGLGGDDIIVLGAGNDTAAGRDGADVIRGGAGDDAISGGNGKDLLRGGAGADLLKGNSKNDVLRGGSGNDTLGGGSGWDTARGGAGNDSLRGFTGNDVLRGGDDDDVIFGGAGDDLIYGGRGIDGCRSGPGSDVIRGCEN